MSKSLAFVLVLVFLTASVIVVKPVSSASPIENSWTEKTPMPLQVFFVDEATVVKGTIYLIGVSSSYDLPDNLTDIISNNYAYNPSTGTETSIAPMPTPRVGFSTATFDDKIYVIGGFEVTATNGESPISCSVNEVYNPSTNTWATAAPMPVSTAGAQANTVNGKIYVMGGLTEEPSIQNTSTLNITQIFDPTTDSWSTGASLPYPVVSAASAAIDNDIYIIGGIDQYLSSKQDSFDHSVPFTQIYDTTTEVWRLGPPFPGNPISIGAGATTGVNASKRIYTFGGVTGFNVGSNQTYAYNPVSNLWTAEAPMPVALLGPAVAVINDVFYVIGNGQTGVACEQYIPIGYGTPDPSYILEHTPANITLLSPLNQTYNHSAVPLVFTANKPFTWASYSLDGGQNITITGNGTITNVTNGLHSITVYANDTFGNIGASENITFQVKLPELSKSFQTTIVSTVSIAVVAVVVAGLLVYFKKRKRVKLGGHE